jgi:uncharacterized protein YbgA (DUF1722 family)/uncharacterized protein YbbK (DUF523 family)
MNARGTSPIRIGVSACLMGQEVRFDGGHKRDDFLTGTLGKFVEFVAVCPEVDIGLGVPRESLRLVRGESGATRMVANKSGADLTDAMSAYAERRADALARIDLSGYVLKKDSPSCGMERVRVYGRTGMPARDGRGLFADALIRRLPNLPVEEEGRLNDPRLRENFIERAFAYHRMRALFASRWTAGALVAFHTAHKLTLMAHSPSAYAALGRLVAGAKRIERAELRERYSAEFMAALKRLATPARHVNVMQHIAGYLRDRCDTDSRRELMEVIEEYRRATVPLIVPLTLIRHWVRCFDIAYLKGQTYLEPHPRELMLRNHV